MKIASIALLAAAGMAIGGCLDDAPVTAAGTERHSQDIIGGVAALPNQYPMVAALHISTSAGSFKLCTATLLRSNILITARHCTEGVDVGKITAVIDDLNAIDSDSKALAIVEKIEHPGYDSSAHALGHDLALLRLAEPLVGHATAAINTDAAHSEPGKQITLVGYGRRSGSGPNNAGKLYVLANKTVRACSTVNLPNEGGLVCYNQAAPEASGSCSGDSGGPGFAEIGGAQTLVSVVSFGDPECNKFGGDIQIDSELAFIEPIIEAWAPPQALH